MDILNLPKKQAIERFIENHPSRSDEFKLNLDLYKKLFFYEYQLGLVDNSSLNALRPAACPRDPRVLNNEKTYYTDKDRTGSRGQAAGRRHLNCQQMTLVNQHLIPGAIYLEWIASLFFHVLGSMNSLRIRDFKLVDVLFLSFAQHIDYTIKIHKESDDNQSIFSVMTGVAEQENNFKLIRQFNVECIPEKLLVDETCDMACQISRCNEILDVMPVYDRLAQMGVVFGTSFRHISKISYSSNSCFAKIQPRVNLDMAGRDFVYHPTRIYSAFQVLTFFLALKSLQASQNEEMVVYLPTSLNAVWMQRPSSLLGQCYVKINDFHWSHESMNADLSLFDDNGLLLIKMEEFGIVKVSLEQLAHRIQAFIVSPNCAAPSKAVALTMLEDVQALLQNPLDKDFLFALYCAVIFLWASKAVQIAL